MIVDARDTGWFKSSRSSPDSDACVEVRMIADVAVGLRDSKNPGGGTFWVSPAAWSSLTGHVIARA